MRKSLLVIICFLMGAQMVFAQQSEITGIILDENNQGMPFVTVSLKGTTKGAITDDNGRFMIDAKSTDTLRVSFIGYDTKLIAVGNQTSFEIKMASSFTELEEVMVVAYGTTKKASFTGSASVVKAEELEKMPVISVDQAMAGSVSGLQVSGSSGQPGSAASIRIRGIGSFNASNEPLFVVDGVPMITGDFGSFSSTSSNLISSLNPNDIANISVLKDAAAASLYGSRAANGVILITTKRGKEGKTKFKFKTERGFSDLAVKNIAIVDGAQERELKYEGLLNYFSDQGLNNAEAIIEADANIDDIAPERSEYSDWEDALFQLGTNESYEFSASGGTEKTSFFSSLGYIKQNGVMKNSDFDRISGRLNLDHKANDLLSFGMNLSVSSSDQNVIPDGGAYYSNPFFATRYFLSPTTLINNEDGSFNENVLGGDYPNIVKDNGLNIQKNHTFRSSNNMFAKFDLYEGLAFKTTFGFDAVLMDMDRYWSPLSNDGATHQGYGDKRHRILSTITSSNILSYVKSFNKHNIDVIAGYEVEDFTNEYTMVSASNYPNSVLNTIENASKPLDAFNNKKTSRMISYLSRVNYNYANTYYLSASFRRDGSSRLAEDVRYANFWSVSGSWRISQEAFLADVIWLDDWKIRASYGTNGTLPTDYYGYRRLFGFGNNYYENPGSEMASLGNVDLTWEKNKNFNIGTEIKIYDFLSVDVEYFRRMTTDLLLDVPISHTIGFDQDGATVLQNVGEMLNSGYELTITSDNFSKGDFKWTTSLNVSTYKNEIVKLYEGQDISDFPYIYREGESINSLYLREWAGVDPATGSGMWYKNTTDADGNITSGRETTFNSWEAEKTIVGTTDPDFVGGITNTFSYKGIDLSLLFTFRVGGSSYDATSYQTENDGRMWFTPIRESQLDRWQNPGDVTDVPRYVYNNSSNSNYNSSRRLHKADYLRLKNITVGYTLPRQATNWAKIQSARVYMNALNVWTLAAYDGYDPETDIRGSFGFSIPPLKSMNFGIEINL